MFFLPIKTWSNQPTGSYKKSGAKILLLVVIALYLRNKTMDFFENLDKFSQQEEYPSRYTCTLVVKPTAITEKEPLPSKITTAKESEI